MKLAVAYLFKLFLIWATFRTIYQLANTFKEKYTTFLSLPIDKIRFSVRVCFDYSREVTAPHACEKLRREALASPLHLEH